MEERILNFINNFQNIGTIQTFTEGCCYWFAEILRLRFEGEYSDVELMYNQIDGHFCTRIDGTLYDITGVLTDDGNWMTWCEFKDLDPVYAEVVERDCILKVGS